MGLIVKNSFRVLRGARVLGSGVRVRVEDSGFRC